MKAELKDPYADKNFSVHFICDNLDEQNRVWKAFHYLRDTVPNCNPFLQGDSATKDGKHWFMIEFWTFNPEQLIEACEFLQKKIDIKIKGFSSKEDEKDAKMEKKKSSKKAKKT